MRGYHIRALVPCFPSEQVCRHHSLCSRRYHCRSSVGKIRLAVLLAFFKLSDLVCDHCRRQIDGVTGIRTIGRYLIKPLQCLDEPGVGRQPASTLRLDQEAPAAARCIEQLRFFGHSMQRQQSEHRFSRVEERYASRGLVTSHFPVALESSVGPLL